MSLARYALNLFVATAFLFGVAVVAVAMWRPW
jgi:hypothetical protein